MRLPIVTCIGERNVGTHALIDSGAEGIFINRHFVNKHRISTAPLDQPLLAKNVDNTVNKQGIINSYIDLKIVLGSTPYM